MKKENRDRLIYAAVFVLLLVIEMIIGLFVRDAFIRPYLGDTLIVILIWALVRVFIPRKAVWLAAPIFVFAVLVELTQLIPLADALGINNRLLRVIMGTSFSVKDVYAYAAGCLLTLCVDIAVFHKTKGAGQK